MAQKKPYNPYTKYGRKKQRELNSQIFSNMTPVQKQEHNSLEWIVSIIVLLIIGGIMLLIGGSDGLFEWLSK